MKNKVSIIGAGSWGTTLAVILSKKGIEVTLHSVFKEHNLTMQRERMNALFLKGIKFPRHLNVSTSLKEVLASQIIIIAIPVKFVRGICKRIKKQKVPLKDKVFVSVSKGIEAKSLKRVSEIIHEELGKVNVAVLSGPNIAKEILVKVPSTTIIACKDKKIGKRLQGVFSSDRFRVYLHHDIIGVELGGAIKNIIAIACGISDGLRYGTNTKAALVTRGLAEITRLGKKMGAKPQTFWGISGLGDLVTTCFSPHSRNRSVGEQIGKGKKLKEVIAKMEMVAEGIETVKSAFALKKKFDIDMPITHEIYHVLYKDRLPGDAMKRLMKRPLKIEKVG